MKAHKEYFKGVLTGFVIVALVGVIINLMGINLTKGSNGELSEMPDLQKKVTQLDSLIDDYYIFPLPENGDSFTDTYLKAYVDRLGDPYTLYMTPDDYLDFSADTEGRYAGIGIQVMSNPEAKRIVVVASFAGFPAAEAGVLPGDEIVAVNGEEITSSDMTKAVEVMKGEPGTTVEVKFYRPETAEEYVVDIERKIIDLPTVTADVYNDIGYILISQFNEVASKQFSDTLEDLQQKGIKGLIVDLRNNPGGQLDVVRGITEALVPPGLITYTVDKQGQKKEYYVDGKGLDIPMVLLVNEWSASASELLTGAVKDSGAGTVVGKNTFGKGIVQSIFVLDDKSALKVTMSEYFSPKGTAIHEVGIAPDIEVDLPLEARLKSLSSLTLEEDTQLQKALEILGE